MVVAPDERVTPRTTSDAQRINEAQPAFGVVVASIDDH
jgi:hypothetical protein